jgi:hypothetical protein
MSVFVAYLAVYSITYNPIGDSGRRQLVDAIMANEDSAMIELYGLQLADYCDVTDFPEQLQEQGNERILEHIRQRRLRDRVKSARGGTR